MALTSEEERKLEEIRRRAEEEEARRIDEEVAKPAEELMRLWKERGKKKGDEPEREVEEKREREGEAKQKAEEERRPRYEEEERKRPEDEEKKRREQEARRKAEDEEIRKRDEEGRERREQGARWKKEEEETRRKEQERRQQVEEALHKAQEFLDQREFDKALAQVAKALASYPMHAEALALGQKIRTAKSEAEPARVGKLKEAEQAREEQKAGFAEPVKEKRRAISPKARKPIPKRAIIGGIAAVIVIVVGIVVSQMSQSVFEGKRYVAILPFASQANTEDEQILGTALAEETAILLKHFAHTWIMGANSAVNLQRITRNARMEANKLNFAHTVTGTISSAGKSVILNVNIIDTLGKTLWTGRLEKPRDNLMELPTQLARTIAQAIAISLSNDESEMVSRRPTTNGDAYILYLRGREMLHQGTHAATKDALGLFQQATSQDPNFAEAYAAAAHSFLHIYEAGWSDDPRTLSQAEGLAKRANNLSQHVAEAHTVLGGVYLLSKKYEAARDELDKALNSMPSDAETRRLRGIVSAIVGEEDKAMGYLKSAYELDPVNIDVLTTIALVHQRFGKPKQAMVYFNQALPFINDTTKFLAEIAGNALVSSYEYDRAIRVYEQRVGLNPKSFVDEYKLARAYQLAGKPRPVWSVAFEKTIAKLQREIQQNPQNVLAVAYLGLAYSRYGRFLDGEAYGKKALQMAPNNLTIKYKLADLYSVQKKKSEAITSLKEALKSRYILAEIVDLDLFNVSDEPEFQQIIVQVLW